MEKYLISLTIRVRVEPDPNEVVRATTNAQAMKWRLLLLGTKGSYRMLQGEQVTAFSNANYMEAAKAGLLYVELEPEISQRRAFSPEIDKATGMPLLLERYEDAFARRQQDGAVPPQAKLPMNA